MTYGRLNPMDCDCGLCVAYSPRFEYIDGPVLGSDVLGPGMVAVHDTETGTVFVADAHGGPGYLAGEVCEVIAAGELP